MDNNNVTEVSIIDIKMPFWSMVVFLIKLALASIPAFIVLGIIFSILGALFGGMFGMGMGRF